MQTHLVTAQPFPRRDFLDIAEVAILLDVDGTILDVAATPQGVVVPASLVRTLAELHGRTGGALALVSGRLIENLDRLFVPHKGSSLAVHYRRGSGRSTGVWLASGGPQASAVGLGRLCQAPIRGTGGSVALSRALHPPRRHLQPPPDLTFKWKDYRLDGAERYNRVMTLPAHEFIRRFLMHVLPAGFHRIRYYGFLTCQTRDRNIARIRELLAMPLIPVDAIRSASPQPEEPKAPEHPCPCCGGNMRIIEIFLRGQQPKHKPTPVLPKIRINTS